LVTLQTLKRNKLAILIFAIYKITEAIVISYTTLLGITYRYIRKTLLNPRDTIKRINKLVFENFNKIEYGLTWENIESRFERKKIEEYVKENYFEVVAAPFSVLGIVLVGKKMAAGIFLWAIASLFWLCFALRHKKRLMTFTYSWYLANEIFIIYLWVANT